MNFYPSFGTINEIKPEDRATWEGRIFLTFDIDWATDFVLDYVFSIVEEMRVRATWFVTHDTDLLQRLKENELFEMGIHPNFNFLLDGDFRYGKNVQEVIGYFKSFVENPVSIRSHSLTQSGFIFKELEKEGFKYECNNFVPLTGGVSFPYFHTQTIVRVSHFFEDDVRELYDSDWDLLKYFGYSGIKVFDFHPIHIYLNSENLQRYNNARPFLRDKERLDEYINKSSYGTKDFFIDLVSRSKNSLSGL